MNKFILKILKIKKTNKVEDFILPIFSHKNLD